MIETPPVWWQAVMTDIRDIVAPRSTVMFELIRKCMAEQVKAGLIPSNLTESQARKATQTFVLILLEEIFMPHVRGQEPDEERFIRRCVEEMEVVWHTPLP